MFERSNDTSFPTSDEAPSAQPAMESRASAHFKRLRACTYVARTWHTKLFPSFNRTMAPTFEVREPKAFRRAYVETWMKPAMELVELADNYHLMIGSSVYATVTRKGAFIPGRNDSTITTNPKTVRELAGSIFRLRTRELWGAYERITGEHIDDLSDVREGNRVFVFTQHASIAKVVTKTMKLSAQRLDPDAGKLFRSIGSSSGALLARIANPDPVVAVRWRQALHAYPLLTMKVLHDIVNGEGLCQSSAAERERELKRVIENGLPLVPFFATFFSIPESVVRRYQGIHPRRVAVNYGAVNDHIRNLPRHCELPPHLRPQTKADYIAADRLFQDLEVPARHVKALTNGVKAPLSTDSRLGHIGGFRDVRRCLSRLLQPFLDDDAIDDLLYAGRSLGALVRLNESWHRAHRDATAHADKIRHVNAGIVCRTSWQPLTLGPIDLGEMTAVELTTRDALVDEGVRMQHCVGGYADYAVAGTYRILSIRDKTGASLSTTCFMQKANGAVRLVQHYAARNSPPPSSAAAAVRRLIPKLRSAKHASRSPWPRVTTDEDRWDEVEEEINDRMRAFWIHAIPDVAAIVAGPRRPLRAARRRRQRHD